MTRALFRLLEDKKVVLFGAGSYSTKLTNILREIYNIFPDYYVDNATEKWDNKFIYSPEKLTEECKENLIIIIASSFKDEIKNQLMEMGFVEDYHFLDLKQPRLSYSQGGEDLLISDYFYSRGIENPNYLEIGAYDPKELSNTYLLYLNGSTGVCIDANPDVIDKFKKYRPNDIVLNYGIGLENKPLDFYRFNYKSLNTFSLDQVNRYKEQKDFEIKLIDKIQVNMITINDIINTYFIDKNIDILSLDVEGMDFEILNSINYDRNYIQLICVESGTFGVKGKDEQYDVFLKSKGYTKYAETMCNTIYVKEKF